MLSPIGHKLKNTVQLCAALCVFCGKITTELQEFGTELHGVVAYGF